jgi:hypothetical protein
MTNDEVMKKLKAFSNCGCTRDDLRRHIEAQWAPGMSWENHSRARDGWQIDHIKPKSSVNFRNEAEYLAYCHYTNLRPIWALEHTRKNRRERHGPRVGRQPGLVD